MPNVRGLPVDRAKEVLTEKGLTVMTRLSQTDQNPPDTVIDHRPSPGVVLKKGQKVELLITPKYPTGRLPARNIR
jgi:beta-lactam-binding protein with PASTA domain